MFLTLHCHFFVTRGTLKFSCSSLDGFKGRPKNRPVLDLHPLFRPLCPLLIDFWVHFGSQELGCWSAASRGLGRYCDQCLTSCLSTWEPPRPRGCNPQQTPEPEASTGVVRPHLSPHNITSLYLSQIAKCIFITLQNVLVSNCKMYLSHIAKCICLISWNTFVSNCKMYLSQIVKFNFLKL